MAIAALTGGGFAITWSSRLNFQNDIFHRVFNSSGAPVTADLTSNLGATLGDQRHPDIVGDGAGGFYVVWEDTERRRLAGEPNVQLRHFDATGQPAGSAAGLSDLVGGDRGSRHCDQPCRLAIRRGLGRQSRPAPSAQRGQHPRLRLGCRRVSCRQRRLSASSTVLRTSHIRPATISWPSGPNSSRRSAPTRSTGRSMAAASSRSTRRHMFTRPPCPAWSACNPETSWSCGTTAASMAASTFSASCFPWTARKSAASSS